jgi:23S rRNA pseudouridine2605 synthase
MHPKYQLPRSYHATVSKKLNKKDIQNIKKGVLIDDKPVDKIFIKLIKSDKSDISTYFTYDITVFEGRNRIIRKIFEKFGSKVIKLKRYKFGDIDMPKSLQAGNYIHLNKSKINCLKNKVLL